MRLAAVLLAGAALLPCACGTSAKEQPRSQTPAAPRGPVVIRGTTLDAATGAPLAGVEIEGPGGLTAVSGPDGRFELRGLEAGRGGVLLARTPDGERTATNRIRRLREGALEVVLHLR